MEDMTSAAAYYQQSMLMTATGKQPELPEQEQLKCPRCDSPNTKFCYYNNYNLSQPRHFCKSCRRYWTKGGSLRNIPVGGGSRKNAKRSGSSSPSATLKNKTLAASDPVQEKPDSREFGSGSGSKSEEEERISSQEMDPTRMLYGLPVGNGSFSSLLASNMQMGGIVFEGLNDTGSRWYPGMGMGMDSGFRRSEDAWTDLAMNRVEKN